jgi:hypothetical protein
MLKEMAAKIRRGLGEVYKTKSNLCVVLTGNLNVHISLQGIKYY